MEWTDPLPSSQVHPPARLLRHCCGGGTICWTMIGLRLWLDRGLTRLLLSMALSSSPTAQYKQVLELQMNGALSRSLIMPWPWSLCCSVVCGEPPPRLKAPYCFNIHTYYWRMPCLSRVHNRFEMNSYSISDVETSLDLAISRRPSSPGCCWCVLSLALSVSLSRSRSLSVCLSCSRSVCLSRSLSPHPPLHLNLKVLNPNRPCVQHPTQSWSWSNATFHGFCPPCLLLLATLNPFSRSHMLSLSLSLSPSLSFSPCAKQQSGGPARNPCLYLGSWVRGPSPISLPTLPPHNLSFIPPRKTTWSKAYRCCQVTSPNIISRIGCCCCCFKGQINSMWNETLSVFFRNH